MQSRAPEQMSLIPGALDSCSLLAVEKACGPGSRVDSKVPVVHGSALLPHARALLSPSTAGVFLPQPVVSKNWPLLTHLIPHQRARGDGYFIVIGVPKTLLSPRLS